MTAEKGIEILQAVRNLELEFMSIDHRVARKLAELRLQIYGILAQPESHIGEGEEEYRREA